MKSPLNALLSVGLLVGGVCSSQADTFYWGTAAPVSPWQGAGNWFLDASGTSATVAVPGASDDVVFSITSLNGTAITPVLSATTSINSLTFDNTVAVTITGTSGNRNLEVGAGGITLSGSAANVTLGSSSSGKNIFVKIREDQTWTNNSAGTFNVRNSSQASDLAAGDVVLTLNAAGSGGISNSGAFSDGAAGSLGLIVDSAGTGVVSMANSSYSGGTTVLRGVLQSGGNFGSQELLLGDTTGTANVRLHLTGVSTTGIIVRAGSSGAAYLSGSGSGDYQGDILLNKDVSIGSIGGTTTLAVSGDISGTGSLILGRLPGATGNPTVTLTGNNSYTGKTTIDSATVVVNSLNRVVGGSSTSSLGAPTTVENGTIRMSAVNASTLRYAGTGETTDRVIEIASNAGATLDQAGFGTLNFSGSLAQSGAGSRTLTLTGTTAGIGEYSGVIDNSVTNVSVTKNGSGTWRLSGTANTYAGSTSLAGGVLEVTSLANTGFASSIGTGSIGNISFSGGALKYVGTGDLSNRVINMGGAGGTLDASGSGAVVFSNTSAFLVASTNVSRTLTLTGTSTAANTLAANLINPSSAELSVTKDGAGTWALTGSTSYTGATTVNAGTLLINGRITGSDVTVTGGVFGGTGTVTNAVSIGGSGTLAPGNSAGTLNTGDLSLLASTSTLAMEISGTGVGQYDRVNVTGAVNLDGNGQIALDLLAYTPVLDDLFFLVVNDGSDAISGTLFGLAQGATFAAEGYLWKVGYTGDSAGVGGGTFEGGNDLVLQVVPEPATCLLLTGGLMAVTLLRRRRVD